MIRASALEAVRVMAEAWNEEARAAHAFQDPDDVQREYADRDERHG